MLLVKEENLSLINPYFDVTCVPQSLSKAIPEEELVFLKAQFMLMDPEDGGLYLHNFTTVSG